MDQREGRFSSESPMVIDQTSVPDPGLDNEDNLVEWDPTDLEGADIFKSPEFTSQVFHDLFPSSIPGPTSATSNQPNSSNPEVIEILSSSDDDMASIDSPELTSQEFNNFFPLTSLSITDPASATSNQPNSSNPNDNNPEVIEILSSFDDDMVSAFNDPLELTYQLNDLFPLSITDPTSDTSNQPNSSNSNYNNPEVNLAPPPFLQPNTPLNQPSYNNPTPIQSGDSDQPNNNILLLNQPSDNDHTPIQPFQPSNNHPPSYWPIQLGPSNEDPAFYPPFQSGPSNDNPPVYLPSQPMPSNHDPVSRPPLQSSPAPPPPTPAAPKEGKPKKGPKPPNEWYAEQRKKWESEGRRCPAAGCLEGIFEASVRRYHLWKEHGKKVAAQHGVLEIHVQDLLCPVKGCDAIFDEDKRREDHIITVHRDEARDFGLDPESLRCTVGNCGARLANRSNLRRHMENCKGISFE